MESYFLVSPTFSDLATPNFEVRQFPDGENYVWIPQVEELKGKNVVILHRLFPHHNSRLVQLFQILSIVKPLAAGITVVAPYLPYARQDDTSRDGEALSAQMLCGMLAAAGVKRLVTFDSHFSNGPGEIEFAGLKVENRTMAPELIAYVAPRVKDPLIITIGDRTGYMVGGKDGPHITKVHGGYIATDATFRRATVQKLDFDVTNRNVIIIEDVIAGGTTMADAAQACKAGGAKNIVCAAVHGLLVGNAFDRIRAAGARQVVVTDSVPGPAAVVSIVGGLKGFLP